MQKMLRSCRLISYESPVAHMFHHHLITGISGHRCRIQEAKLQTHVDQVCCLVAAAKGSAGGNADVATLMSVDADRTVNMVASGHECWSLPLQIIAALCLLYSQAHKLLHGLDSIVPYTYRTHRAIVPIVPYTYTYLSRCCCCCLAVCMCHVSSSMWQVGSAFVAGLVVIVALVPLNRWLANRIAASSSALMAAKDARLRAVSDTIANVRAVKCGNLEGVFSRRICHSRVAELRALAVRKYLDAG